MYFFALCIIAMLVTSSCGLVNRLANNGHENKLITAPYDVVIVPGVPYNAIRVNQIYKARMLWAKWLYDRKIAKNIIFSGAAVHSPYVEAETMKIMADSMGIPAEHTFAEKRAEHSTENVDYSIQLARSLGFKKIAVATDPFQSHFIRRFIEKCRINVALVPFPLQMMPIYYKKNVPKINAGSAFKKNFTGNPKKDLAQEKLLRASSD
jgi:uncharacterized SAM-binding protein YcdF (DUF218 family)